VVRRTTTPQRPGRGREALNKAVNGGLADPKPKARLTEFGNAPLPSRRGDVGADSRAGQEKTPVAPSACAQA
jgi:hypothetical protein